MILEPRDESELTEAVRTHRRVLPIGHGTKPGLTRVPGATLIRTAGLSGIVEYEPTEYTFTARAGTSLTEVASLLASHGQYLPFDPPLVSAGATLGGTVAAAMSGPGRLRYGGVRDFVIGIRWIDGTGQSVRGGGKVVKNAAGFDFPKLFCGSIGRLGILTELSFKVFPAPEARRTLRIPCASMDDATRLVSRISSQPWEVEALEILTSPEIAVIARFMGDRTPLGTRIAAIAANCGPRCSILGEEEADFIWTSLQSLSLPGSLPESPLLKIPTTLSRLPELDRILAPITSARHYSVAGNLALIAPANEAATMQALSDLGLPGLRLRGRGSARVGPCPSSSLEARIAHAMDPEGRFIPPGE
jgi:glycolate oxidase FAD binding subunit